MRCELQRVDVYAALGLGPSRHSPARRESSRHGRAGGGEGAEGAGERASDGASEAKAQGEGATLSMELSVESGALVLAATPAEQEGINRRDSASRTAVMRLEFAGLMIQKSTGRMGGRTEMRLAHLVGVDVTAANAPAVWFKPATGNTASMAREQHRGRGAAIAPPAAIHMVTTSVSALDRSRGPQMPPVGGSLEVTMAPFVLVFRLPVLRMLMSFKIALLASSSAPLEQVPLASVSPVSPICRAVKHQQP